MFASCLRQFNDYSIIYYICILLSVTFVGNSSEERDVEETSGKQFVHVRSKAFFPKHL